MTVLARGRDTEVFGEADCGGGEAAEASSLERSLLELAKKEGGG